MSIKVNIHRFLQQFTNNQSTVEVRGKTVGECLDDLIGQFPGMRKHLFSKNNKLLHYVRVPVNPDNYHPLSALVAKPDGGGKTEEGAKTEQLAMPVKDGDELSIVLMLTIGGG
jgi:molybdopterin converting factor small subunit